MTATGNVLEGYVSRKEFARQVGKDERTVIRWELERRAPRKTTIGRNVYYSRAAIQEWLQKQEQAN